MFLTEYPNGNIMQRKRRLAGYKPHKKKQMKKKFPKLVPLTDSDNSETGIVEEEEIGSTIDLSDISSDDAEWTSSSDSELIRF